MNNLKLIYTFIFIILLNIGCFSTTQITRMENDLDKIKQQNNLLKDDIQNFKSNSMNSNKNISEVVDKLYKINADLSAKMNDLQSKIETLQGKIEELSYRLTKYDSKTIESTYNIGGESTPSSIQNTKELQAIQVFNSAQNDYRKGFFDLAILGFKQFLTLSSDKAKLADAQYWIGECYYSDNKLEDSIVEFDTFIRSYPSDNRIPGAMFKKAITYFRLKKLSISKTIFQEIIGKYPNSPEAKLANERLNALKDMTANTEESDL